MTLNKKNLIVISKDTKARLEKLKHPGQTWDGVIEELLNSIEAKTAPEDITQK